MPEPTREEQIIHRLHRLAEGLEEMARALKSRGVCTECGRAWLVENERWRSYLLADETLLFCPECSEREFSDGSDDA
jgi:hypothetical protein